MKIVDLSINLLREKCPNTEVISGPYFPLFRLNTEIYEVNTGHFTRRDS